ncbi:CAP domain-containing protein [Hufsiella ginkgonis]|nr:CAP domain-containing protein [Hufsiella ginkgonis]
MSFTTGKPAHTDETFKYEVLGRINTMRAKGCNCGGTYMPPADPVVWNDNLAISAYAHARDMAANRYFSHYSLDGRKLRDRTFAAGYAVTGYKSWTIGENIAQGQRSIREVTNDWFNSPGHCKNLMNPDFREVGVAVENLYWVQDFGGRVPFKENYQATQ